MLARRRAEAERKKRMKKAVSREDFDFSFSKPAKKIEIVGGAHEKEEQKRKKKQNNKRVAIALPPEDELQGAAIFDTLVSKAPNGSNIIKEVCRCFCFILLFHNVSSQLQLSVCSLA